jgi:AcrR family transcriptional regulator
VQQLKESVRQRIQAAAAETFMRHGYRGARLQDVAQIAEISTGNLYRYYRDKCALFAAVVSSADAARLLRLLRARVRELSTASDWQEMTAVRSERAHALLSFFAEKRVQVVILLAGSDGAPLAHVRPLIVRELTRLSAAYLRQQVAEPESVVPRAVLVQLFINTVEMIVAILRTHRDPASIQLAFSAFWRYQLAGLQALFRPQP